MNLRLTQSCRLCNTPGITQVLSLSLMPWADDYTPTADAPVEIHPVTLCRCKACGHMQLREIWGTEKLARDYTSESTGSTGLRQHCEDLARQCLKHVRSRKGALLFLDPLAAKNGHHWAQALTRLAPTDSPLCCLTPRLPSADPAHCLATHAFWTLIGLDQLLATHGQLDGIVAYHFIHNLDDLRAFFQGIALALKPDGVFSFESFYWGSVQETGAFDFLYHEHLSALHVTPLVPFCASLGLELFDAHRTTAKQGSLFCHVQKQGAGRCVTPALTALLQEEQKRGLSDGMCLTDFRKKIAQSLADSQNLLKTLLSDGARVACYGASATTTALLSHFAMYDIFDSVIDDNPHKQGHYTPWRTTRVQTSETLYTDPPDYVYIAAWRYADAIMARHRAYTRKKGTWIIPLPTLRVIRNTP